MYCNTHFMRHVAQHMLHAVLSDNASFFIISTPDANFLVRPAWAGRLEGFSAASLLCRRSPFVS
jgi:hypothetical protein